MNDIDHAKLDSLRLDLETMRATMDGLNRRYHDAREDAQRSVSFFRVSTAASVHWRSGDDPVAAFLTLSAAQQAEHPVEIAAARAIAQQREAARAVYARIEAARPAFDALLALVNRCNKYALEA